MKIAKFKAIFIAVVIFCGLGASKQFASAGQIQAKRALAVSTAMSQIFPHNPTPEKLAFIKAFIAGNYEKAEALATKEITEALDTYITACDELFIAIEDGECDSLRELLHQGTDPNIMDVRSGNTPVMMAAAVGQPAIMQMLIDAGAQVNTQSFSGCTALHYVLYCLCQDDQAVYQGMEPCFSCCPGCNGTCYDDSQLDNCQLSESDEDSQSDEQEEITRPNQNQMKEILAILLEHGADLNVQNNEGVTSQMLMEKWASMSDNR